MGMCAYICVCAYPFLSMEADYNLFLHISTTFFSIVNRKESQFFQRPLYLYSEICNYFAGEISNNNYFIKVHSQFISGEESEDNSGVGCCHICQKVP